MAIDFATFLNVAPHILNSKLPVLIRGRHGVGKSEVVYQIAASRDLPVIERRASQMTEGDLLGLPDVADTCTLILSSLQPSTVVSMARSTKLVRWTRQSLTAGLSSM